MRKRVLAMLLAAAMVAGMVTVATPAASAATQSNDYISFEYNYDSLAGNWNTITVNVQDDKGNQLGNPIIINDFYSAVVASVAIKSLKPEYEILSVEGSGRASISGLSYSPTNGFSFGLYSYWTLGGDNSGTVTVTLCEPHENPTVDSTIQGQGYSRTYRVYDDQLLKMLHSVGVDVTADTEIEGVRPIWVNSFAGDSLGADDINREEDYWNFTATSDNAYVAEVEPNNIRCLEITYDNGNGEETVYIYAKDLEYVIGTEVADYYSIELSDDSFHVVYFYNAEGAHTTHFTLYAVEFVEDGQALGEDMPDDPTYPDTYYQFVNWEQGSYDGTGAPFFSTTVVNDDLTVFARKVSSSGIAGTEIHVINTGDQLLNRVVELYNAANETDIAVSQIDRDSVTIRVNGKVDVNADDHTNEDYYNNGWESFLGEEYYLVHNYDLPEGLENLTNTHVGFDDISGIVVYFSITGIDEEQEICIPVGDMPGTVAKRQTDTDHIINLSINAAPEKPSKDDLENETDGLLKDNAVKVDCTNTVVSPSHEDGTYGLLANSYSIGEVYWSGTSENAAYYVDVTVQGGPYVTEYDKQFESSDPAVSHTLTGDTSKTITLKWNGTDWVVFSKTPVAFTVDCGANGYTLTYDGNAQGGTVSNLPTDTTRYPTSTTPVTLSTQKPSHTPVDVDTDGDGTADVQDVPVVFIGWTAETNKTNKIFSREDKATFDDSILIEEVTFNDTNITVYAAWGYDTNGNGTADVLEDTYTVTYTDGVEDDELFADQETTGLLSGDPTPAFTGSLDREGFVFTGWSDGTTTYTDDSLPAKVTGTVTYTAKWEIDEWVDASEDGDDTTTEDSEIGGDGIPDSQQALIQYAVAEGQSGYGSVEPDCQVVTLTEGGDNTFEISSTATAASGSGYAFDYWLAPGTDGARTYKAELTGTLAVTGGQEYTYTAYFAADSNGDGTADSHQVFIKFTVNDVSLGSVTTTEMTVNLVDENGDFQTTPITVENTATPKEGAHFVNWTLGDAVAGTDAALSYELSGYTAGQTYTFTANFARNSVPINPPVTDPDPDEPGDLNTEDHFSYLIGYEDGTIRPENDITRAEVATIFFRLLTDEAREEHWSTVNPFGDVDGDDWFNTAVSTMSEMGVVDGYEDGTFRPDQPITRAEFVTIATRFFDYAAQYEPGTFTDVEGDEWYADFIQAGADLGLIDGYEDGSCRPGENITRAEAAAIVNRVLNRRPHEDHLLDEDVMNAWPDNPEEAWYYAHIQEATNTHDYDWVLENGETVEEWTGKLPDPDWDNLEQGLG